MRWIAGKGEVSRDQAGEPRWLTGVFYEITERKQLEARLLALNETLEARVAQVQEEARTLEILNRTGGVLASELSLDRLVQSVTDAGVELSGAEFGAFFYNVVNDTGEAYLLYTLSGAPREAFANFPNPRNTAVFDPTFTGAGPVRSDDILADPRYGKNPPYYGMPPGPFAGAQLSRGPGSLAVRRGGGRPVFRPLAAGRVHRASRTHTGRRCGTGSHRYRQRASL